MENIVIRKITPDEVESAMDLALEVFMEFEAPDYGPEGVETFKKDIVENPEYLEGARQGLCPIYGAFDGDKLDALTLNSSPYGLPFYLALCFTPLTEEQKINGIRFTPMKYQLK